MKAYISSLASWTYMCLLKNEWNKEANEQLKMPTKIKRTAFKFAEPFLEADSMKMAIIDRELNKVKLTGKIEILPNEGSVKFYQDLETKEYSWEDHGPQSFTCYRCYKDNNLLCEHRNDLTAPEVLQSLFCSRFAFSTPGCQFQESLVNAVFNYVSDRTFFSNDVLKEFAELPLESAAKDAIHIASQVLNRKLNDVDKKSPQFKQTPLMLAARYDSQIVSDLILRRADMKAKDCNQRTALHHALNCGNETAAIKLIEGGADLDAKDCNQTAPLHIAAREGYRNLVWLMIEKGAEVNPKDCIKRIPLHFAAEGGHHVCCRVLLQKGEMENAKDEFRKTPLMYAARCVPKDDNHSDRLEEVVWLLLKHGANTKIKDCNGHTAIFGASEKCITAIKDHQEEHKK